MVQESTQEVARQRRLGDLRTPNRVQELRAALHAKAKATPGYRFYSLYDKVYRTDVLTEAYRRSRANGGTPGPDGERFKDIAAYGEERWLGELAQELKEKKYRAQPIKRAYIRKPNGKLRRLGIPSIRDRVVMRATVMVLEPIFEADLEPEQHAYRSRRQALAAVKQVHDLLNTGHREVVDADLAAYFDSLPHPELMKSIARRVSDRQILHLIKEWLTAAVEEDDGSGGIKRTTANRDQKRGASQGSPLSPLLSNVYMRRFILGWKKLKYAERYGAHIVNYADDLVICCKRGAEEAMQAMRQTMQRLKLTVNEEKTQVSRVPQETFDFLGYSFGRRYASKTGRAFIGTWPSKKSVRSVIEKISVATEAKTTYRSADEVIEELNASLRGWAQYFCLGPVSKAYRAIDAHTKKRLRRWLCRKHKVAGGSLGSRYSDRYLHDKLGLIDLPGLTKSLPWAKA